MMAESSFVIPPTNHPTHALLLFNPSFPPATIQGPSLLPVLWLGVLVAAVASPSVSGKWRLLQTFKLPIWRSISGKGRHEAFLTHSANTEFNNLAEYKTSLLNNLQLSCGVCFSFIFRIEPPHQ